MPYTQNRDQKKNKPLEATKGLHAKNIDIPSGADDCTNFFSTVIFRKAILIIIITITISGNNRLGRNQMMQYGRAVIT